MGILSFFIDFILHLDVHLNTAIQAYGTGVYLLLFLIIFVETGLVFTPFLPGDSLLFAAGAFAALQALDVTLLLLLLSAAAIIGDTVNYHVGKYAGRALIGKANGKWLKKEHFEYTERFYEKYGNKAIVLARFVPVARTFAPFLAGVGKMPYGTFLSYNILGGLLWVFLFVLGGYFFGNIPVVKENFSVAILIIILLSFVPIIIHVLKHRRKDHKDTSHEAPENIVADTNK